MLNHQTEEPPGVGKATGRDQYAALMRSHLRRVLAICLSHLGQQADAEDAAQEIFLRGFRKLSTLHDPAHFKAWIDQIARNHCRDLLRRRNRRPESPWDAAAEALADPSPAGRTDDEFLDLRRALAQLPDEHRLPLVMYYFNGRDTRAVAHELGLSKGGACSRLFRARMALRARLEGEANPHD